MFNPEKEKSIKNFDDVSKDAKRLKDDSIKLKDEAVSYAKSNADEAIGDAKAKAREAGKNVYDFLNRNSKKLKDAEETTVRTIKDNPLVSAGTAFAAGLILGSIFKRSRKDNA